VFNVIKINSCRILNYGSCFSASVAHKLIQLYPGYLRYSSVQHVRIDVFNDTYLRGKLNPVLKEDLSFSVKELAKSVIDNQCSDSILGRSLPYGADQGLMFHPVKAVEDGVDVVIFDNFPELLFRVYVNEVKNKSLYFHFDHLVNSEEKGGFDLHKDRISPIDSMCEYIEFFRWVKKFNPNAKAVFLNFPVDFCKKVALKPRMDDFQSASLALWNEEGFGVVNLQNLSVDEYTDPYHFVGDRYRQYAYLVEGILQSLWRR
jgi:hypothetical protein